jgi:mitogen-activated protein kinase kinase kinase 5
MMNNSGPEFSILSIHPDTKEAGIAFNALEAAARDLRLNVKIDSIPFDRLDKGGETSALDVFYNADIVVGDLSERAHRAPLFYQLGIRESFEMHHNIVTFLHKDEEETLTLLKLSCVTYKFVPYFVLEDGTAIAAEVQPGGGKPNGASSGIQLFRKFRRILQEMDVSARKHHKEFFLNALRKAREDLKEEELKEELGRLKKSMDEDHRLYTGDIVVQLLLTYRDMSDYDAMVNLVEQLPDDEQTQKAAVQQHYAFALNRRKKEGDREKALQILNQVLQKKENHVPDLLCLCGRIYKDKFVESERQDKQSLENAIVWYRRGFEVDPNIYAGINLATLLVISGKEFNKSTELDRIGIKLNNLLGKKGSLETLKDYWDVATFFEISVLAEDYSKACAAAECMFKLKPPTWNLKSTLLNIKLINSVRNMEDIKKESDEKQGFNFWMDFFVEATADLTADLTDVRFPVGSKI